MTQLALFGQSNRGTAVVHDGLATFYSGRGAVRTVALGGDTGVNWTTAPTILEVPVAHANARESVTNE